MVQLCEECHLSPSRLDSAIFSFYVLHALDSAIFGFYILQVFHHSTDKYEYLYI
jgi:hypothetical protein